MQRTSPTPALTTDRRSELASRMFGRSIQAARENAGHSIEQAATLAGMEPREWSAIETGRPGPNTLNQLEAIAEAVGMQWAAMADLVILCRDTWGF